MYVFLLLSIRLVPSKDNDTELEVQGVGVFLAMFHSQQQ